MNIGIFTDTYYPQVNGVVTSIRMLEKELNRRGHKVYIFTTTDPESKQSSPRVFRLPSMPFIFLPSRRFTFVYSPKLLIKIKKFDLDIVHTQTEFPLGFFGKLVSEFYKIPLVHTYHTMYEDYVHYIANGHLISPKMAQKYSRFFCNRADQVVAPVQKTKESLLEYKVKKPIDIIPSGLDFDAYKKENYSKSQINNLKLELGLNLTDPIILSLGRVSKEKSIDIIFYEMPKVLKKLPLAKLVVVGDGPMLDSLKTLSQTLKISDSIVFTGGRPWEEIGLYYQLGDVFASASQSETQGLTYIEALSAKVPIVVKKDKSLEGIITHKETGFYFEKNEDFSDVIYDVLTNKALAKDVAEKGYLKISHLSAAEFAKNMEALYIKVLSNYELKYAKKKRFKLKFKFKKNK